MNRGTRRIALLISGTGAVAQGVIDAARLGALDAEVVAIVSHEPWSYGLLRAEREQIPALLHDLAEYRMLGKSDSAYSEELAAKLQPFRPDVVLMAGWRLPLSDAFFARMAGRLLRIDIGIPGEGMYPDPYGRSPISRIHDAFRAGQIRDAAVTLMMVGSPAAPERLIAHERLPLNDYDRLSDIEERATRLQQEMLVAALGRLAAPSRP